MDDHTYSGTLFQTAGAAAAKTRSPMWTVGCDGQRVPRSSQSEGAAVGNKNIAYKLQQCFFQACFRGDSLRKLQTPPEIFKISRHQNSDF